MNPVTWLFRVLIRGYQLFISPVLPGGCRFYPGCSAYALEAIEVHGPLKGAWLGLKRIGRCHPWNAGGLDPVPKARTHTHHHETHGHHRSQDTCGHTEHNV